MTEKLHKKAFLMKHIVSFRNIHNSPESQNTQKIFFVQSNKKETENGYSSFSNEIIGLLLVFKISFLCLILYDIKTLYVFLYFISFLDYNNGLDTQKIPLNEIKISFLQNNRNTTRKKNIVNSLAPTCFLVSNTQKN